jgi:pimeloyl-ACP methyl ester carboxylesterase
MANSPVDADVLPRTRELISHTIRYVDHGRGPVVVLIHGLMGSLHDWDPQISELSKSSRVIAVDLPGHGESDKVQGDYSLSAHAATIRDLLSSLDIDSATLVGHSYGGGVAMQTLYLFPEMVDRICLVASGGLGPEVNPILRAASIPGSGIAIPVAASAPVRGLLGGVLGVLSALRIMRLGAGDRRAYPPSVSRHREVGDRLPRPNGERLETVADVHRRSGVVGVGRARRHHSARARTLHS